MALRICVCLSLCVLSQPAAAGDWPAYRHDTKRSGVTTEQIPAANLQQQWVLESPQAPRPAWPGPAKWDAYAKIRGLRGMRDYDKAFHVAVVGRSLFYASSADDAVHCVDTRTGTRKWSFVTDAPVRMAPTVADGRVYFGSDDGHAYCVDADRGDLIWKSADLENEQLILNNGRFISRWPCRTGVLVADGVAYYGLSLLPWKHSWLCAVDSKTGRADGPGHFTRQLVNQTLEGGLLLQDEALIALRGRVAPYVFARGDGREIGELQDGGGGVFATLSPSGELLHGPGNKTGWITRSSLDTRKKVATFGSRTAVIATEANTIFLSDAGITATDTESGKVAWESPGSKFTELILAGDTLFVGGDHEIQAFEVADGTPKWQESASGRVHGLVVADGALFATTDEGVIQCFRPTGPGNPAVPSTAGTAAAKSAKTFPTQIDPQAAAGLIGHWRFHSGMGERARRRGLSAAARRVQNLAGSLDGIVQGNVQLREVGGVEALELDGTTNSILISDDHNDAKLPVKAISIGAWVRVDSPLRWGGIIGAMQDNGSYERGWILGYEDSRFSFAVAGNGGPDKLTYLRATTEFEPQVWYHVVGTYDGTTQNLYVNGTLAGSSTTQQGPINYPPRAFLEIGAYHDQDEYYRMTGMLHEVLVFNRALTAKEIAEQHAAKSSKFPIPVRLASGPSARFTETDQAVVTWRTAKPSPTILNFEPGARSGSAGRAKGDDADGRTPQRYVHETAKLKHEVTLTNLKRNRVGRYTIETKTEAESGVSQAFELDTSFNYSPPRVSGTPRFAAADTERGQRIAARLLADANINQGLCLVLGIRDASLAFAIAQQSKLSVVCVDTDAGRVESARRTLLAAGVYGTRICVRRVESFSKLPFAGRCANLVVSERQLLDGELVIDPVELYRVLRPSGGVAWLEWSGREPGRARVARNWLSRAHDTFELTDTRHGLRGMINRTALRGAGEWSHLYGRADNSAFGGETLAGASTVGELAVQWIGRPGPRAQPDRNGRKPAPLSKNGRLFVQGLHRLIGVDALNGTPLWTLEIPSLERFNMPRDCGNWCADDDHVFVAIRGECWQIDAQTGTIRQQHTVVDGDVPEWEYDWSYIARVGGVLLGSAVRQGTAYTNFWGNAEAGWYDARSGSTTYKVCSENLFALDPATGEKSWVYTGGVILNSTITATDDHIWFVECRNETVRKSGPRRVGLPELWLDQYLVALNTKTGAVEWERAIDTEDGVVVFNLAGSGQQLILSSSGDKQYHVYSFSAVNGERMWEQSFGWPDGKGDHGKAMSRPAIVGDTVYVRPRALDLKSGEIKPLTMPGGGCGTYAATTGALFFRSGNVTAWNTDSGSTTSWNRLRPGCWLSTIPANGMLLSPEAGGGCSCGSWLETSVGFMPTRTQLP